MLRWREATVYLVFVTIVSGDLKNDLKEISEAIKKSKTDDFLTSFGAAYAGYLRLCQARVNVVLKKSSMDASLQTGLQSFDKQLQSVNTDFSTLLTKFDGKDPRTSFGVILFREKTCDDLRTRYLNADSTEKIRALKILLKTECSSTLITLADELLGGFSPIAGKQSYVQKYRDFTFNAPRTMEMFVRGMVKVFARAQVLELTGVQLSENGMSDAFVNARVTSFSKKMKEFIDNAKKILKAIAAGRMTQIKADIVRYLKDKSKMTMCRIANTLHDYLRNKYNDYNFGVLVFNGRCKNVVQICSGTYAFGVGNLNGIVVVKPKSSPLEDRGVWMTEILNKLQNIKANGEKHYAMMKQVLTKIGMKEVCKKLVLVAVIDTRASQCLMKGSFSYENTIKNVHRCNTSLCWIKRYWNYQVNLVG